MIDPRSRALLAGPPGSNAAAWGNPLWLLHSVVNLSAIRADRTTSRGGSACRCDTPETALPGRLVREVPCA